MPEQTPTAEQIRQEVRASAPKKRNPQIPSSVTASILVQFLNDAKVNEEYNLERHFTKYGKDELVNRVTNSLKAAIRKLDVPAVAFEHEKFGSCLVKDAADDSDAS